MSELENMELIEEVLDEVTGGKAKYYTIQKGDTLIKIANRFGTTVKKLCEMNCIDNPDHIVAGKKIRVA